MNSEKTKGILITTTGAVCWGLSGCMGQYLFTQEDISAVWLVSIRLLIAGSILALIGFATKKKDMLLIFKDKKDIKALIYFSFCGLLLSQLSYFLAIEHSNAGTATALQSLCTIFILIYICIKQLRLPRKVELFALVIALLGAFLLTTGGNIENLKLSFLGLAFGLSAAIGAVFYSLISIDLMKKYGVYVVVGFGMLIAGFFLLFFVKPWTYDVTLDKGTILGVAGVIIFGTLMSYSFFLKGISIIGSFMGSLIGNLEPVTAIVVSVVFLGSVFTGVEILGIVLILLSVVILAIDHK